MASTFALSVPLRANRFRLSLGMRAPYRDGWSMGVYEQHRYPFLRGELRLIQRTQRERNPVLGVCLGSQLLAAAFGGPGNPGRAKGD